MTDDGVNDNNPLEEETDPLRSLMRRLDLIWDRTREVAHKERRGFYLHGRGGTGKTMKVTDTLAELGVVWELNRARFTKGGLREYVGDCVDRSIEVIVLDDCGPLLEEKQNISFFQAVLDGKSFSYRRQGQPPQQINFTGGIIFISNDPMPEGKTAGSLKSRGRVLEYSPTDKELAAWMRKWAAGDGGPPRRDLTIAESTEAIEFLIAQSLAANAPIDLRLADKTYGDFWAYKHKKTKSHWQVLVMSEIQQTILGGRAKQELKVESRDERLKRKRAIVRDILAKVPDGRKEQIKLWLEMVPNGTERTFDRRKREVQNGME